MILHLQKKFSSQFRHRGYQQAPESILARSDRKQYPKNQNVLKQSYFSSESV